MTPLKDTAAYSQQYLAFCCDNDFRLRIEWLISVVLNVNRYLIWSCTANCQDSNRQNRDVFWCNYQFHLVDRAFRDTDSQAREQSARVLGTGRTKSYRVEAIPP
jgi:hypothetical protein